jgi:hypothetical protein
MIVEGNSVNGISKQSFFCGSTAESNLYYPAIKSQDDGRTFPVIIVGRSLPDLIG